MDRVDDEIELIRRLLSSVDGLATAPNVNEEIRGFANEVNTKYKKLQEQLDERDFQQLGGFINHAKEIKAQLEESLRVRRNAGIAAAAGAGVRLAGNLLKSKPIGDIVFWVGFGISSLSDLIAESAGSAAKELATKLEQALKNDNFREHSKAVRDLDDTIRAYTGLSIYDDEFQELLEQAAEDPDRAEDLATDVAKDAEERNNLVGLVKDKKLLRILRKAVSCALKEDIAILTGIVQGLNALNFMELAPNITLAVQVGEIALRGIILVIEHNRNSKSLSRLARDIEIMKKDYEALDKILGNNNN